MKACIIKFTCFLIAAGFLLCGCGEDEKEVKVLKFVESYGKESVTAAADLEFSNLVEEKSGGGMKVEVYTDGELGGDDISEKVLSGEIEIARVNISDIGKGSSSLECCDLPFIFKSKGHMQRAVEQVLGLKLDLDLSLKGGKILGYMDSGARNLYTAKPVEKPEDLSGLKIRTEFFSKYSEDFFINLGAKNVKAEKESGAEEFKDGKIDGAEDNIMNYYLSGEYKYAPNILKIEYRYLPDMIVINKGVFDALSDKEQAVIISAAAEACQHQKENFEHAEKETEEKLISEGCKITYPSEEFKEALNFAAELVFKEIPRPADIEVTMFEQVRAMR